MKFEKRCIPVCLIALGAATAHGGGLELNQHGVKELSHGFAGTATLLEDASAIAHNPAGLTRVEGSEFSGGLTALYADIDYNAEVRREKLQEAYGLEPSTVNGPGNANSKQVTPIPHLYYGHKVNEDTAVGIGLYAPFGSGSKYPKGWAGRYHAEETSQSTVNINPTIAVNLSDELSMGLGAIIQSYEASLTNQIDVGYLVAEAIIKEAEQQATITPEIAQDILDEVDKSRDPNDPTNNRLDVQNDIEIDSVTYGFSFGLLWEPRDDTSVGFNFRSETNHLAEGEAKRPTLDEIDIEGDLTDTLADFANLSEEDARASARSAVDERGAAPGDLYSRITFPAVATLSLEHDLSDQWSVMGSISYINWSVFDELRLEYELRDGVDASETDTSESTRGGSDITGSGDDVRRRDLVQPLKFEDTMRYGLGARYRFDDRLTLRFGGSYDETPIPDSDYRTPRGPDNDRIIVGLGGSYTISDRLDVDLGYAFTKITEGNVSPQENPAGTLHRAEGTTEASLHSLGMQANYQF